MFNLKKNGNNTILPNREGTNSVLAHNLNGQVRYEECEDGHNHYNCGHFSFCFHTYITSPLVQKFIILSQRSGKSHVPFNAKYSSTKFRLHKIWELCILPNREGTNSVLCKLTYWANSMAVSTRISRAKIALLIRSFCISIASPPFLAKIRYCSHWGITHVPFNAKYSTGGIA